MFGLNIGNFNYLFYWFKRIGFVFSYLLVKDVLVYCNLFYLILLVVNIGYRCIIYMKKKYYKY